ncbi:hypothetical protein LX32DRAFT_459082 [Colletotrichum zoysiae]|uniref:DUF6919 domain-containing protein n=1 Tax=Colletotrichum zoysiae TaxID=1216348 RepID=A0AAD9M2Z9_9PEZI|nr:hypothetical protein LX32DRAFT_459082 [Colletotrichum zoysiae]
MFQTYHVKTATHSCRILSCRMALQEPGTTVWCGKWERATDWKALVKLNVQFIELSRAGRKDIETPYHYGALDAETEELIPSLLRLHNYGLLTTDSQPLLASSPRWSTEDSSWYESRQVPFVSFFSQYQTDGASRFLRNILEDSRLIVIWTKYTNGTISSTPKGHEIMLTFERKSKARETIESAPWRVIGSTPATPLSLEDYGLESVPALRQGSILSCMVTVKHERDLYKERSQRTFSEKLAGQNMLAIIEEHAAGAGLKRSIKASKRKGKTWKRWKKNLRNLINR